MLNTYVVLLTLLLGGRPLPSYLGGGDLDGDVYNVTTREDLIPPQSFHPASYDPAPKKILDRESTMADVADFVAEFISSDVSVGFSRITCFTSNSQLHTDSRYHSYNVAHHRRPKHTGDS